MSSSLYLKGLTLDQRKELEQQLYSSQKGNCFICGDKIDLALHANAIDIDHIEPLKLGGKRPQQFRTYPCLV
jgi:CRISPR/Cas system Type II protein with McrA/HNH and RuvC-like nuclease domain